MAFSCHREGRERSEKIYEAWAVGAGILSYMVVYFCFVFWFNGVSDGEHVGISRGRTPNKRRGFCIIGPIKRLKEKKT